MDFKMPDKTFLGNAEVQGGLTDQLMNDIDQEIKDLIEEAFGFAQNSPKPSPDELLDFVYAD